ncbi:MAG: lysozyme family protein [Clostridia bacterium]|nr:lysozyme family protein [Clostridia bacterium]
MDEEELDDDVNGAGQDEDTDSQSGGQEQEDGSSRQSTVSNPINGIPGAGNKARQFIKSPINSNTVRALAQGLRTIINAIPIHYRIIAISVVVLAIVIYVIISSYLIIDLSSKTVVTTVNTYVGKIDDPLKKADYDKNKSLLLFSLDDINSMYTEFMNSTDGDKNVLEDLTKKFKNGNKISKNTILNGAISSNDERELYKHILLTEKYNFNNVKWKEYNHGVSSTTSPKMKVDSNLGLQYPDDPDINVKQFVNMLYPYLQSWYIPLAMYSGSLNSGTENVSKKNTDFAYQIVCNAYSDITMAKYDMETLSNEYEEIIYDESRFSSENKAQSLVKSNKTINTSYYIESAKTFDLIFVNEYNYVRYNENNTPDYVRKIEEPYSDTYQDVEVIFNNNGPPTIKPVTKTRTGKKIRTIKTWSDRVEQSYSSKYKYGVNDIEEFSGQISQDARDYYSKLEENGYLDRIMLINSNKDIYPKYVVRDTEYAENVGYDKSYLTLYYSHLRKLLLSMSENINNLPIVYGQTLDINLKYNSTDNIFGIGYLNLLDTSSIVKQPLSAEVEAYRSRVEKIASEFGMSDYVDLILAVMMQESGGRLVDVMQSSESLGLKPNEIGKGAVVNLSADVLKGLGMSENLVGTTLTNEIATEISLRQGIKYLKYCLDTTKGDIVLALQCYNYGTGFYSYAIKNGGYSLEVAAAFSDTMAAKYGWDRYGDKLYVLNVLRYYNKEININFGSTFGQSYSETPMSGWLFASVADNKPAAKFGEFNYKKTGGRNIDISDTWEANNLVNVQCVVNGEVFFTAKVNKAAKANFEQAFKNIATLIENDTLSKSNVVYGGSYVPRYMASGTGKLSYHSWGIAIDFNYSLKIGSYVPYASMGIDTWNSYQSFIQSECGGIEANSKNVNYVLWKYAFEPAGFRWGGNWRGSSVSYFDPMHYEINF